MKSVRRILLAAGVAFLGTTALFAQSSKSSMPAAPAQQNPSRVDIFAGYSYLAPHATVTTNLVGGGTYTDKLSSINEGAIGSVAYYFNRYLGGQIEYENSPDGRNDGISTIQGGIIGRYPMSGMTPFVHALAGAARVGGPNAEPFTAHPYTWGPALTVGGGLDYDLPFFHHHLSLRLFQADYEYLHANYGPAPFVGGRVNSDTARLSTGLVWHLGSVVPPPPVAYSCSASPETVYPGGEVTVTGMASNLNPKKMAKYSWMGQGVTVNGSNSTAKIDTSNLQPGTYKVMGHVTEGNKAGESADCTTMFTVKQFQPPTVSCVASPMTVQPGQTSTITATGVSPQNLPLTYTYSSSAGTINGSGNSATLETTGAPSGPVTVTCNVQDDKGQTASSTTTVDIQAPPPPPAREVQLEHSLALHSVFFPTDQPTPRFPERGLVESQRQTLRTLAENFKSYMQYKPDASITLTGHADIRGSAAYNKALTERRVQIVKDFLVDHGVPASAIQTEALGESQQLSKQEVKKLVDENPDLTSSEKAKMDRNMTKIYLAQNRRVDITLNNTGQKSVKLYPFNAADLQTLMSEKAKSPKRILKEKKQ
jgi:outer membrane protein OmpA-like peptidoglycan-associated protein